MKECYSRGWISPRDGNASQHDGHGIFRISPAGVRKDQLGVDHLIKVTDGKWNNNGIHCPSGELQIHMTLQQHGHPFVLHCHPPWILAYVGLKGVRKELAMLRELFPELRLIIGPNVPYIPARTDKLSQAVAEAMPNITGAIIALCNHRVVVTAFDYMEALEIVETCEYYAKIAMLAQKNDNHQD